MLMLLTTACVTQCHLCLGQSSDEGVVANMLRYTAERAFGGDGGGGAGTSSSRSNVRLAFEHFQMLVANLCAPKQGS
jgi:hypothetical protein